MDHCPLCQGYLQLVIEQLSTTAQDSIFNSQENGATPSTNPKNSTGHKPPKVQEKTNEVLSANIKEINEDLSTLTILELDPTVSQHQEVFRNLPVSKQYRPPHCKTCGHPKKGHCTVQAKRFVQCVQISSVHHVASMTNVNVSGTQNLSEHQIKETVLTM